MLGETSKRALTGLVEVILHSQHLVSAGNYNHSDTFREAARRNSGVHTQCFLATSLVGE